MQVSSNNFRQLWLEHREQILDAIDGVGGSAWYILGEAGRRFEEHLGDYCGRLHAVGCGNGMDAIEIALRSAGVQPGDKVLTTPLSAFATGLAVLRAGAVPVFCDVDEHGLLDPMAAEAALKLHPDIRGVLPVHLYGHLADMERFAHLGSSTGAYVIEDAAQAIGARRGAIGVGDLGLAACLSFYPTKNLGAMGDGGALLTDDADLASKARVLRNYGQSDQYVHSEIGLNSRLDEVQAAILGKVFLPRLSDWTTRRRAIARHYLSSLSNPRITLLSGPDPDGSAWHLFPVLVAPDERKAFMDHLRAAGVQTAVHYPTLIPEQAALASRGTYHISGDLSRAASFAAGEVSLPINPFLRDEELAHVVATVNGWKP